MRLIVETVHEPWTADASCRDHDPEVWFSTNKVEQREAKQICGQCPVRDDCLEYALSQPQVAPWGIWGGLDEKERESVKRRNARRATRGTA